MSSFFKLTAAYIDTRICAFLVLPENLANVTVCLFLFPSFLLFLPPFFPLFSSLSHNNLRKHDMSVLIDLFVRYIIKRLLNNNELFLLVFFM